MNQTVSYHSEQVHTIVENGNLKEKRNIVNIKNGKGTKTVILRENGKTRKSTHLLNPAEKKKIENGIFINRLFKKCHDCLNGEATKTRTKRKSRSRTQKKKKVSS